MRVSTYVDLSVSHRAQEVANAKESNNKTSVSDRSLTCESKEKSILRVSQFTLALPIVALIL